MASQVVAEGVSLDGAPVRAADRVDAGRVLVCRPPTPEVDLAPEPVDFGVLFEDEHLIVVDKPAGVVVHPGTGRSKGTLAAGLLHRFPDLEGVGAAGRSGLVHRLDKDTSGVLLVARTQADHEKLTEDLRRRRITRIYTALAEGAMSAPTGTIEAPIGRDPTRPMRRAVTHGGKAARTHFEVLRHYPGSDVTLLNIRLETGRTHQIRVHLSAIDHPVVGDLTYGATRKDIGSPRTFLHAATVELAHPATGEMLQVTSPLPDDLKRVLATLS
jgi:23S rRNA pseudouridine1911/1915/1917 synthase